MFLEVIRKKYQSHFARDRGWPNEKSSDGPPETDPNCTENSLSVPKDRCRAEPVKITSMFGIDIIINCHGTLEEETRKFAFSCVFISLTNSMKYVYSSQIL